MGYYDNTTFHYVVKKFLAQAGDPTGNGGGRKSYHAFLVGDEHRFIPTESHSLFSHQREGIVGMVLVPGRGNGSQVIVDLIAILYFVSLF